MLVYIDDPKIDWFGKRVFCRLDLNVPLNHAGDITDDTRIRSSLPTIQYLLDKGARLVVASHLGRPKGKIRPEFSLEPVAIKLHQLLNQREIIFAQDCIGDGIKHLLSDLKPGSLLLLENLRFHSSEERNEESFAKLLAQNIDIYVNDAFGTLHRAHASVKGITRFISKKYAGFLIRKELQNLNRLFNPEKPFVAILGGSKVSDKIGLVAQLLSKVNTLIIGGAMAYTFLKARGFTIGKSKFEEDRLHLASIVLQKASQSGIKVLLPQDHVVVSDLSPDAPTRIVSELTCQDIGVDIGPQSLSLFEQAIRPARTLFWNGPMGIFEWSTAFAGTLGIAQAVANTQAFQVVGGGDSVAALQQTGVLEKIAHISTGGGASLEYIQGLELPGLIALEK